MVNWKWNSDNFSVFRFEFHCLVIEQQILEVSSLSAVFFPYLAHFFQAKIPSNSSAFFYLHKTKQLLQGSSHSPQLHDVRCEALLIGQFEFAANSASQGQICCLLRGANTKATKVVLQKFPCAKVRIFFVKTVKMVVVYEKN